MSNNSAVLLGVLENLLAAPLKTALGSGIDLVIGPVLAPTSLTQPRVVVSAGKLRSLAQVGSNADDGNIERESAWQSRRMVLLADEGKPNHFTLPANVAVADVAEVGIAPGKVLRAGDDYLLQESAIVLLGTPASAISVMTRGAAAQGYREKTACQIAFGLEVWALDTATCDTLTRDALLLVLATLAEMEQLDLSGDKQLDSSLRLLKLRARTEQIERQAVSVGATAAWRSLSQIAISAELELNLVLGAAVPEGRIKSIEIKQL